MNGISGEDWEYDMIWLGHCTPVLKIPFDFEIELFMQINESLDWYCFACQNEIRYCIADYFRNSICREAQSNLIINYKISLLILHEL